MGVRVVKNAFPQIAATLLRDAKAAESTAAKIIAAQSRADVPVRTGALRDSIRVVGSAVTVLALYAGYQEFGTRNMEAHPYFRRALGRGRDVLDQEMRNLMSKLERM